MHPIPVRQFVCAFTIAIAASTPSWAQSSVAVGGLVDVGVFRGFDGITQVGTVQRSNLALSGHEDLGGGVQAIFRLSTRMELDTGAGEGAGYKPFWHDESTLGLKGPWGTVRVGRAMTAMWANDWKFDPWANFNRIASPAWYLWHPLTPSDPATNNGADEYGRIDNGIFYDSPTIAGVTVRLSGSPERRRAPGATGLPYSTVVEYGQGRLAAMAAFERNSRGDKDTFVAGKYTAGPAALMAAWDDSRTFDASGRARAVTLDATYRIGAVTLKAGWGRQRLNADLNHFASVGADYPLSRRTTLYVSAGRKADQRAGVRTSYGGGMAHAF